MIGCVSAHSGIFYMHAKVHNPGNAGIRNACVQILIGDRHLHCAQRLIANKDSIAWSTLASIVRFATHCAFTGIYHSCAPAGYAKLSSVVVSVCHALACVREARMAWVAIAFTID